MFKETQRRTWMKRNSFIDFSWLNFRSGMLSHDSKLRCDFVDFYYTLYGSKRPLCLPIPELGCLSAKPRKAGPQASPEREETIRLVITRFFTVHALNPHPRKLFWNSRFFHRTNLEEYLTLNRKSFRNLWTLLYQTAKEKLPRLAKNLSLDLLLLRIMVLRLNGKSKFITYVTTCIVEQNSHKVFSSPDNWSGDRYSSDHLFDFALIYFNSSSAVNLFI